jgi:cysteine desulfurase
MATYLDHAATTPMRPAVRDAMLAELTAVGNPSSLHGSGRARRRVIEEARERVAAALNCHPIEVIFTGSGTEANNLAIKGTYWAQQAFRDRPLMLVSSVEHHAVLDPAQWLVRAQSGQLMNVVVDHQGRVDLNQLRGLLAEHHNRAALVSIMWANNEVGTVQPIFEAAALAAEFGIPIHSDAVQAVGAVPVDFAESGLTALTVAGHKVGGPLGVGALLARRGAPLIPLLHGGGQERDVRSGTLDTPAIVGFAVAIEAAIAQQTTYAAQVGALRDMLIDGLQQVLPEITVNGDQKDRLPGNVHVEFPGCAADSLLLLLDAQGIECSIGSACSAGVSQPSHVLLAMGRTEEQAQSCLRFSLGRTSTADDVTALLTVIREVVDRARNSDGRSRRQLKEAAS